MRRCVMLAEWGGWRHISVAASMNARFYNASDSWGRLGQTLLTRRKPPSSAPQSAPVPQNICLQHTCSPLHLDLLHHKQPMHAWAAMGNPMPPPAHQLQRRQNQPQSPQACAALSP